MKKNDYKIILITLSLLFKSSLALSLEFESIRIATYNLENFWDGLPHNTDNNWFEYTLSLTPQERVKLSNSPQYYDYSVTYSNWHSQRVLKAKIKNVLTVLRLLKYPDIIAIQEIESARNKSQIFQTPYSQRQTLSDKLKRLGYKYLLLGKQEVSNPVSVTTAFISKVAINSLKSIEIKDRKNSTSARDLQVVELKINKNERVILFNNHWKSKRGSGNEETRVEIAKELTKRITEEKKKFKNTHIIILGDLNTSYREKPMRALKATGNKIDMTSSSNELLYNLWYELPYSDRWESSFNGIRNTLSHILISDSLYNKYGFHYIDRSFSVLGQKKPAKDILLNVDGKPLRWQIKKLFDKVIHTGKGYSDHLPLVATFEYKTKPRNVRQKKQKIDYQVEPYPPLTNKLLFNEVQKCQEESSINLLKLRYLKLESLVNKCVKIDVPLGQIGFPLFIRGKYRQTYIKLQLTGRQIDQKTIRIGLSMNRPYDWRPNIDDSRVSKEEAEIEEGLYNSSHWHPKSNKCYTRRVLQGKGGTLRKIVGAIGYQNGYLTIHANSREEKNLILEQLPEKKELACSWTEE